ncbi:hypothetical protein EKK58_04325 [Candidatus Dependentiae bacterium]|nr:MAG: hypothetical protein EKK58_04325 [Candidatus Dependentiae bacterium]
MSDLYFRKKEQLSNSVNKNIIVDAGLEIEKKRAMSPVPIVRSASISTDKKVAYKSDIDDLSKKLEQLKNDIVSFNDSKNELEKKQNELINKVDNVSKLIEATKVEGIKNSVNEAIKKMNDSLRNVCDEMIKHQDKLNAIESHIETINAIL